MYLLKMAARNIRKNSRRSLFTALAMGLGFASICIFSGYIHNVYSGLSEQAVHGEGLGHLTLVKKGYFENGTIDAKKYLLTKDELARIGAILSADSGVQLWTPRLAVDGLVSNGHTSTIFMGEGIVPEQEEILRAQYRPDRGGMLDATKPTAIVVSSDLARLLGLKTGANTVVFTTTLDGQANALDADVGSIYNTGIAATNDKTLLLPLAFTRRLLDTDGADRLRILLRNIEDTDEARSRLTGKLSGIGIPIEIRTWKQLSTFYVQVKALFDMIFTFIFSIVAIIVVMSVTNTMSMTVIERTREIGTLRALGMKRRQTVVLFSLEAMLLAAAGCVAGCVVTIAVCGVVKVLGISYVPPNTSDHVPLLVDFVFGWVVVVFFSLLLLAAGAAYIPSAGASRTRIVDALGHV
jgi:putative ABC transport system permease protein